VHRAVVDLFEELRDTPAPPGYAADRARRRAARRGFLPPSAWVEDTIDDPNAMPITAMPVVRFHPRRIPADFADIVEDYRQVGRTDEQIAAAFGISVEGLQLRIRRLDDDDMVAS
jgi:hypothetical protein